MRIKYDKASHEVNGVLVVEEGADYAVFFVPGRSKVVQAEVLAGKLNLFPDRSGDHKALCVALGLT